jgi:ribosomal protein S18 acetylase RimI-like enzyme
MTEAMNTTLHITTASSDADILGIKQLQDQNLKSAVTPQEAAEQGFVTAVYSFDFLKEMNTHTPAIVAKDNEIIAGYALATTRAAGEKHHLLHELFIAIDSVTYNGQPLKHSKYLVVGQLCVAKRYRGQALVQRMYDEMKKIYSSKFTYCITDVAEDNPRSLKAHLKSGFKVVDTLQYGGISWHIVLWDWNN